MAFLNINPSIFISACALVYRDSGPGSIRSKDRILSSDQHDSGVDPASQNGYKTISRIFWEGKVQKKGTDHHTLLCRSLEIVKA